MAKVLITGASGQLGKALVAEFKQCTAYDRSTLDIADSEQIDSIDWSKYDTIINAAAYVNADHSETPEGRRLAWKSNAIGPRNLAKVANEHGIHLIHFSSEYVFDGVIKNHDEEEELSPLSVYGQTKAAADLIVSMVPKHHILRTTWVVGDGHNFVKTMKNLADMRINPKVVDDQFGRPTFTSELVRAVHHILENGIPYGVYNVSNSGTVRSWAEIAELTFEMAGHDRSRIRRVSTDEYMREKSPFAPRPTYSDLNLTKLRSTGFISQDYEPIMREYITSLRPVE